MPPAAGRPVWLRRAWAIRAVPLVVILTVLVLGATAKAGPWLALLLAPPVIALALWLDWIWLGRNHHRVNEWGLSKGKNARKRPEGRG